MRGGPCRIGSSTANQAIAAARQIADAIRISLHFRVDLDPANPSSTALISSLYRWDSLTAIAERQRQPVRSSPLSWTPH